MSVDASRRSVAAPPTGARRAGSLLRRALPAYRPPSHYLGALLAVGGVTAAMVVARDAVAPAAATVAVLVLGGTVVGERPPHAASVATRRINSACTRARTADGLGYIFVRFCSR